MFFSDLGRVASQFYIKYDTVEIFNLNLRQIMNEADILSVMSQSSEFTQLKVRWPPPISVQGVSKVKSNVAGNLLYFAFTKLNVVNVLI